MIRAWRRLYVSTIAASWCCSRKKNFYKRKAGLFIQPYSSIFPHIKICIPSIPSRKHAFYISICWTWLSLKFDCDDTSCNDWFCHVLCSHPPIVNHFPYLVVIFGIVWRCKCRKTNNFGRIYNNNESQAADTEEYQVLLNCKYFCWLLHVSVVWMVWQWFFEKSIHPIIPEHFFFISYGKKKINDEAAITL